MPESPRACILVVDDNGAQMHALCDMLQQEGFHAAGYSVPEEALRALRDTRFDVLLTDLKMPGMGGIELIAAARAVDPELAGIVMTGQGTIASAVEAMRTGAQDYVLKPFTLGAILQVLDRALELRRLRQENTGLKLRLQQEERINRLTRIYAVLSGINSAIIRIRDRGELFQEACRIAVEDGKLGIAWIDEVDGETLDILPVAHFGSEAALVHGSMLTNRVPPPRQGLIRRAIEGGQAVFSNDLLAETVPGGPRRAEAIRLGYRSVIVLPIRVAGTVAATMSLFARDQDYFNDDEVKLLVELAGDISFGLEYIHQQEKLDFLAFYDALTGLPNAGLFSNRLSQRIGAARDEGQVFGVLLLDLERFRLVNDTLGRASADELLRAVALRLKEHLAGEELLAHATGNQFFVATRRVDSVEFLVRRLEHVLGVIAGAPFTSVGGELRLAMRAGVSVYPADGADADSLARNAEAALLQAKQSGERYLFYAPEMNARAGEQLKFESALRHAVVAGEFTLHYQPRLHLGTGRVHGVEALLRWQCDGAPVSPARFIPVLEDTGLILEVGRWVLRQAARDHAAWMAAGLAPLRVAVNISAVQLRRRDFVPELREILLQAGESGRCMDIEVTESMLLEDIDDAIAKLRAVRELDVRVALDDFGTGYSSLSYLGRLPIDTLKIDRAFVRLMCSSPQQAAIVSAVVALGRALDLDVVAEGVESGEEADLLRKLHCDEAQGFLFARPMPAAAIESMLRSGTTQVH